MKARRSLRAGIALTTTIVVGLIFLGMPFVVLDTSFLLGFAACLVLVPLVIVLVLARNRSFSTNALAGDASMAADHKSSIRANPYVWILVSVCIVFAGLVSSYAIFSQQELFMTKVEYEKTRVIQQSELIEAVRIRGHIVLMKNLLDAIDGELSNNPERNLRDHTIGRISALAGYLKPYSQFSGDSVSTRKLSPERGQLLMALANMNIDTGSMWKILIQTSFAGADLKGVDLSGAFLPRVDLNGSELRDANLKGADLRMASMRATSLWGANLNKANLSGVDLNRADLRWAELNEVILQNAILDGANLTSAKLRKADLSCVTAKMADFSGAFMEEINLSDADMYGTKMAKGHLNRANLSGTILSSTVLSEASLAGAKLDGTNLSSVRLSDAIVSEYDWLLKLDEWLVIGADGVRARYHITSAIDADQSLFRIAKN